MTFRQGVYLDMNGQDYHADPTPTPSLTQSLIPDLVRRSPMHAAARHPRLNPYGRALESTKAQWFGEVVHRLALGRGREISVVRYKDYQSSSAREARDLAVANGRIPVLERDLVTAQDMAAILRSLLDQEFKGHPYDTEVPIFWLEETDYGPIWCRGLLDAYCGEMAYILDPKILRTPAMPIFFGANAAKSGYEIQLRWYRRGMSTLFPELQGRVQHANLVMESFFPHGYAVLEPDEEAVHFADEEIKRAINLWGKCIHTRSFPGYPKTIQKYSLPPWHMREVIGRYVEDFQNDAT
jgi:hypothetical protein